MQQLLIKNALNTDGKCFDLLIENGKIKQLGNLSNNTSDLELIDLKKQYYLSPGWIDSHTHCFTQSPLYYDDPDLIGVQQGVTTVIDAGSVGADDVDAFYQLTRKNKTHVYAFLNIARQGIISQNELSDIKMIDVSKALDAIKKYPDFIIGIKARMSKSVVGENGLAPLHMAKAIQKCCECGMPLMVHVGNTPPDIDDIAKILERGDIITHCYNGKPNRILDQNNQLRESIVNALDRGVLLDVGHGGESFSFDVAERAMCLGCNPHMISSDIYYKNRINGPVYRLSHVMNKLLALGLSLKEVIDRVTVDVVNYLALPNKGELAPGFDADLTIFSVKQQKIMLEDCQGGTRQSEQVIEPVGAVIAGVYYPIHEQTVES